MDDEIANRLLLSLPRTSLDRLRPALEFWPTKKGVVVNRPDSPVDYHYFVNCGLISLVKLMQDGRSVEIGVVGIEGISNPHTLFGINRATTEAVVQIPGAGFRIKRRLLQSAMANDKALRQTLERYAHFAFGAVAQTAACNRLHHLEERCCRWLLVAHDSARSDTFELTHEFLATMLGVQRAGVSIAASYLQGAGLIRYTRGRVTVTNRAGLEAAACECYDVMSQEYDKVIRRAK